MFLFRSHRRKTMSWPLPFKQTHKHTICLWSTSECNALKNIADRTEYCIWFNKNECICFALLHFFDRILNGQNQACFFTKHVDSTSFLQSWQLLDHVAFIPLPLLTQINHQLSFYCKHSRINIKSTDVDWVADWEYYDFLTILYTERLCWSFSPCS